MEVAVITIFIEIVFAVNSFAHPGSFERTQFLLGRSKFYKYSVLRINHKMVTVVNGLFHLVITLILALLIPGVANIGLWIIAPGAIFIIIIALLHSTILIHASIFLSKKYPPSNL